VRNDREAARVRAERSDRADRNDTKASPREANAALQGLAQVGTIREDTRGVVITLSGSLLFPTGEEELSPIGNQNVDRVAHALAQQPKDTTFDIEGYTDSSGSDSENRTLSERRAKAVADRLVTEGIDSSRIRVVGRGEEQPIADNGTDEGRASNRRVEIVVNRHDRG
jgi:outer membrane protein OmpA-like peptidoglycan-associated protein